MKDLPVLVEFSGVFTQEQNLELHPQNALITEPLLYKEEYDYDKIVDLLRFTVVNSDESPECLFKDSDDNDYMTYILFTDWDKEGDKFKDVLKQLYKITRVNISPYLASRLCCVFISYPKFWDENRPDFWKKVYAG